MGVVKSARTTPTFLTHKYAVVGRLSEASVPCRSGRNVRWPERGDEDGYGNGDYEDKMSNINCRSPALAALARTRN